MMKNKQKDWKETTDGCVNWDITNPRGEKDKREARKTEDVRESKVQIKMREIKEREYRNNWETKSDRESANGGES